MTEPTLEGQDTALYPSVDDEDQNWRLERSATSVDLDPLSPTTRLPGKRRKRSVAVRRGLRQQSAPLASSSARVGKVGNPAVKANVEVLAVVDNSIYRKFLAKDSNNREAALARMRRYYGIVFAMVNQRFQTIDSPDLSITVTMSGLLIAETREDSLWLEQLVDWSTVKERGRASVNTDKALNSFRAWTKTQLSFLPKFDHAMVFSGYRLTNKEGRVTLGGKAYMASICDIQNGFSISIVADEGDFQCIKIAAHELGHSLGALHDGDPGADACSPQGNYIMAPYSGNSPDKLRNAFRFSPCSISWMYTTLRSEKADCVRDKANVFYSYDLAKAPPGLIISLDQHCQMVYGPKATFCRHDAKVKEVVCGQLWCRHPDMSNACRTNSYLSALPGTRCGDGKSCHLGECLPDAIIRQANNERRDFSGMSTETFDSIPRTLHSSAPTQHQTSERGRGSVATDPLLGNANVIPSLPQPVISGRVGRPIRPEIIQARRRHTPVRTERRRPGKSRRKGRCRGEQADANMVYCRGLVTLNPGACKRRDVRNYCCRTCSTLTASGI
ncbi:A disintegrin and metalloproteinase with thrombospondin motifs 3-like isoform X2 [Pomacea canaliculata]|nr:A disintegrin and metalloproteinase with thrombospondin motifs 3-like isoform X2 [Pomacea canaliculata]